MPLILKRCSITDVQADAYVVSANSGLVLWGGVSEAVALAAGPEELQAACDALGGCPVGKAAVTPGFALAPHIIHAVGPVWENDSQSADLLHRAYRSALEAAVQVKARAVALPLLSAGAFGCPPAVSYRIAREEISAFPALDEVDVTLVLFGSTATAIAARDYPELQAMLEAGEVAAEFASGFQPEVEAEAEPELELEPVLQPEPEPQPLYSLAPQRPEPREARRERRSLLRPKLLRRHRDEEAPAEAPAPSPRPAAEPAPRPGRGFAGGAAAPVSQVCADYAPEEAPETFLYAPADTAPIPSRFASETCCGAAEPVFETSFCAAPAFSLQEYLDGLDAPFSTTLLGLIDARGLSDAEVYKRANLSRQHFSKIRSDADYRPTKKTVLALAVAMELTLPETEDLLRRAGFALSPSSKADMIVGYFIGAGRYDVFEINEALYAFDQPLLC